MTASWRLRRSAEEEKVAAENDGNVFSYIEKHQIRLEEYHLATGVGLPVAEYETFKQQLREGLQKRGYHVTEWEEIQIGATIGVHTGPYPMGVGFLKRCQ